MSKRKDPKIYTRNLPHFQPSNGVFFMTYCLNGSLPFEKLKILKEERKFDREKLKESGLEGEGLKLALAQRHDYYFGKFDDLLDNQSGGPIHLRNSEIAKLVKDSILYLHEKNIYKLITCTIMPNHVHKIVYKIAKPLFRIMQSHKGYTGNIANKVLGLNGQFWQHESFDHRVRNRGSLIQKVNYILNNPVKAGLVNHWRDFEHTYINPEFEKFVEL